MANLDIKKIIASGDINSLPEYSYGFKGKLNKQSFDFCVSPKEMKNKNTITAIFPEISLVVNRSYEFSDVLTEVITITNNGDYVLKFDNIMMGFKVDVDTNSDIKLSAVPYKIQQDGWRHIYSMNTLINGRYAHIVNGIFPEGDVYGNSVYSDHNRPEFCRPEPELVDYGILRSEGWTLGTDSGVLAIKHNEKDIEYCLVEPKDDHLVFAGTGLCLYGEPDAAKVLPPGESFTFGKTILTSYESENEPYYIYRKLLNDNGHCFPADYNPPVHWNELYDIGWHHSNTKDLLAYYSKENLFKEAQKAVECGCETLYLDPGWEFAEGLGLWDAPRLGYLEDFIKEIKEKFGLNVALRTIVRTYINYWPQNFMVKTEKNPLQFPAMVPPTMVTSHQLMWEVCASNPVYLEEKKKRVKKLADAGLSFIMFDESDWRGPCTESSHHHSKFPSVASEHAEAIYSLTKYIHDNCPGVICEAHDPVWPWNSALYAPSYFRQGWGPEGSYHENWGFEFMWDCINDLKTGKALSSYYHCLGCDIPLYLHINMGADNDNCVFFWWAASTIRHLGIGGKDNHPTVEPPNKLAPYDHEKRYQGYVECMKTYKKLKKYFVRGKFIGVAENIHLHTIPEKAGGVINLFNIEDDEKEFTFTLNASDLGAKDLEIFGADSYFWNGDICTVTAKVQGCAHRLITANVIVD